MRIMRCLPPTVAQREGRTCSRPESGAAGGKDLRTDDSGTGGRIV